MLLRHTAAAPHPVRRVVGQPSLTLTRRVQPRCAAPVGLYSRRQSAIRCLSAAQTGSPPAPTGSSEGGSGIARGFWTFTGVLAILGSVGGALAALLGWFTTSYALALPLVLPVVSLIASLQREGLIAEDNRRKYDSLSSVLHRESSVLLAEARTAIEDVRRELRVQAASSSKLSGMEARLSSLEGSVLSAGRAVREAGTGLAAVPDRLQRELRAQFDAIVTAVRSEAMRAAMTRSSEEGAALAQLSSQLAALNGALTGLEVAQGEGLRRLTLTLSSNLVDAEAALQALVRTEVERCLEPVRRLPALLASSLPAMLASAQPALSLPTPTSPYLPQQQQLVPLPEGQPGADQAPGVVLRPGLGQGLGQGLQVASLSSGAMQQVCDALSQQLSQQYSQQYSQQLSQQLGLQLEQQLEQQLDQALSQQLSLQLGQQLSLQLGQQLGLQLEQQLPALMQQAAPNAGEVAVARLEGEQWEALGKRLSRMEQLMEGIPRVLEARQQSVEEGLGVRLGQLQQEVQGVRQGLEGLLTSTQAMKAQLEVVQAPAAAPWSYSAVPGPFSPPEALDPDNPTDLQVQLSQQEGGPLQPQLSLQQQQQQQQQQRQEQQREWAQQQERQQQQRQEEWAKQLQQQQQEWAHQMDQQQRQAAQQQQEWALQLQGQVVAVSEGQQRQAEGQAEQLQGLKVQLGDLGAALEGMRESLASSSSPAPPRGPTSSQLEAALEQQQQVQQVLQQEQALLQLRQQQEALMQQQQAWQQQQQQQLVQQQQAWEQQQKAWEERQQEREQQQQREQQQRKREEQEAREGKELQAMAQGLQGEQASLVQQQLSSLVSEVKMLQVSLTALASGLDTVLAARPQAARAQHSGLEASHLDSSLQQQRQQQGREEELSQANMSGSNTSDSSSPGALPHYTAAPNAQPTQQQAAPSTLIGRSSDNSGGSSSGSTLNGSSQGGAESPLRGDDNSLQQQPGSSNGYGSDHSPYSAGSVVAQGRQHSTEQQQQHETQQHQRQLQQQQQQQRVRGLNHQQQQQPQQADRPSEEEQQYQQQEQYQQQQQQQYQQQYQEQEQQQQQAGEAEGGRGYQVADLTRLSEQEVVAEGLRLLRLGREETRKAEDWGLADRLLSDAVAVFSAALQREPHDTRALGNLGNALLAQGELKQAYLEVLREAPPPAHLQETSVQQAAEAVVRGEAAALLTRSGEMFRQVLELEEWSSRALVNWGRALCIRAELAQEPGMAAKLYQAALSKFEAVLEEDPGMVTARYRAALAMAGLAESSNAQDALLLLQNAAIYLQQVIGSTGPEAEGLRPSATTALANCRQALAAVTTQGTRS